MSEHSAYIRGLTEGKELGIEAGLRRAARRMARAMADGSCTLGNACAVCQGRMNGAELALRAVLRRSSDANMREFCRAALKELGGK